MSKPHFVHVFVVLVLISCLVLAGCGTSAGDSKEPPDYSPLQVLVPKAPGKKVVGNSPLTLDISNITQGYLTAVADSARQKVNVQLTADGGTTYSYFIQPGETAVIPFTDGSGTYQICCYQQIDGTQYAALFAENLDVQLDNEFLPFLYPNQYVDFTADSQAVALAARLTDGLTSDVDALTAIYEYVTANITYDNEKAATVSGNYLPDVDETLSTGKGICFDYASLTAAMLRSVGIPAKLAIGYTASVRHAWIDVYIQSVGWVERAVEFNGDEWKLMDPTFAAAETDQDLQEYIGDGDNYITEYVR